MPFCKKCGAEGNSGAFCTKCGTKFADEVATQSTVKIKNYAENKNIVCIDKKGCFEVLEYQRDISVSPSSALHSYFMQEMNFKKRQVKCNLNGNAIRVQAGAMQWMAGKVTMDSDVKGVGDFVGKFFKGAATGESTSKPIYYGSGYVVLEPTYNYILFEDVADWGSGIVLSDGMFLASDISVAQEVISRKNVSSTLLGGEGWFNLALSGRGIAVLESTVPREELIEIELNNDEVRIDGNMAVCWSKSLNFTVEKSTKSFVGSLVSGEGLVNVYRGTGKILMAPVVAGTLMNGNNKPEEEKKTTSDGLVSSIASTLFDH